MLRSLNFDAPWGWALLALVALLLLPELAGEAARTALSYQRVAVSSGEVWRCLTAHFVHLDALHAALNALGLVLLWALFARDFTPGRWLAIYLAACLGVSAGLWLFDPQIQWYVGASGALHGVMTAGTLVHVRRGDLDGWVLAVFIVSKLVYEQWAGALPFAGSPDTVVDAHLYGGVAGLVAGVLVGGLRRTA